MCVCVCVRVGVRGTNFEIDAFCLSDLQTYQSNLGDFLGPDEQCLVIPL